MTCNGKGLTDMYGVNNKVNFPADYGYGKSRTNSPKDAGSQHNTVEEKAAGRKDEILFSAVTRKEDDAISSLSDGAKKLLEELKGKYKNYDFMVADYSSDEEAGDLLSKGKGEYNVLITPDLLEKMAADKGERAKYESIIAGAADKFTEIEKNLTENGKSIIEKLGFTVKGDGTVDFYATLLDGIKSEDGGDVVQSSLISDFTNMLNDMGEKRAKMIEEFEKSKAENSNKPVDKEEKKQKSVLPPKSFEKYEKEEKPYSTEEDYGNLPPESFEKFKKEENPYSTEEDYGTLPPESFKKYQSEADANTADKGDTMNFSV